MICGQNLIRKRQEILGVMEKMTLKAEFYMIINNSFFYIQQISRLEKPRVLIQKGLE